MIGQYILPGNAICDTRASIRPKGGINLPSGCRHNVSRQHIITRVGLVYKCNTEVSGSLRLPCAVFYLCATFHEGPHGSPVA